MNNKFTYDKFKIITLLIIMIGIPSIKLLSYILYLFNVIENSFIVNQVYVLWVMIPILLCTYLYGIIKKKDNINYLDYIMYFLIILAIISTIFAVRKDISLFGENTRYEGLLTLISYYLIFLNTKSINSEKDKKLLINVFLILGIIQVIYSVIQIYTPLNIVKRFSVPYLAMGLCANPNFLGSYMAMLVILVGYLYIKSNNKKYLLLAIIYNIGLVLAESTGPFLSIIITFIFIGFYLSKKEYTKRIVIIFILLLCSFIFINYTSMARAEKLFNVQIDFQYNIKQELDDLIKKLLHIDNKRIKIGQLGNNRMQIWRNLLPQIRHYWAFGAGIDNIKYIYPSGSDFIVDKAHNVYLQILLTNGSFAIISYLGLCVIVFIKGFKLKNDTDIALYMVFIVYSIQAFLNISVIDVAPYFYLFWGLLSSNFNKPLLEK